MRSPAVLAIPETFPARSRHVLTITPFYPSQQNPVSGCFIAEPSPYLEKIGISQTVFVTDPFYRSATSTHPNFPANRIRFFCVPKGVGLSSAGTFLFRQIFEKVRTLHRNRDIDLIHAHAALPCGYAALLIAKALGLPFVITVHGLDASSRRQVGGASGWLCERISRRVYSAAARVLCVSEKVEREVKQIAADANTRVVYNGVDCEYFCPAQPTSDSLVILAIGNLIQTKGFDCLLSAFAEIREELPHARCRIIGEGSEQARLKRLAADFGISSTR